VGDEFCRYAGYNRKYAVSVKKQSKNSLTKRRARIRVEVVCMKNTGEALMRREPKGK
jgi:hypothetical protein